MDTSEEDIGNKLADVPFVEIQALREKLGTKRFDATLRGDLKQRRVLPKRRHNKHRPLEISSKLHPSRPQPANTKRKVSCDPRFDTRTGAFNENLFKKSFSFLDDIKQKERAMLVGTIKKSRGVKKEKLTDLLTRMENKEATKETNEERKQLVKEHNVIQREKLKKGKKPFYFKSSMKKKVELVEKYQRLKKEGHFTKYMEKKRGRTARQDHVKLPFRRRWSQFNN